jgi:cytochrome c oxidase subunit 4
MAELEKNDLVKDSPKEHLLSVETYLKVFGILLFLIFLNIAVAKIPGLSSFLSIFFALSISTVQMIVIVLFFMELIHENRFYLLIYVTSFFFVLLFVGITIAELAHRDTFSEIEDIKFLRTFDKNKS